MAFLRNALRRPCIAFSALIFSWCELVDRFFFLCSNGFCCLCVLIDCTKPRVAARRFNACKKKKRWMPGLMPYQRPIPPPNAGRHGNRPNGGGGRTGPAGSAAPAGGRTPAQSSIAGAPQAPQLPAPPPPGAPSGPAPLAPVASADEGAAVSQAIGAQPAAQDDTGTTGKGRGRTRPQMSQRFCLNFQTPPVGNGFCPYQGNGTCPYVHEVATGEDVNLALQLVNNIRARQARSGELGRELLAPPPGAGRGKGRGRGGGKGQGGNRGQGQQNQPWEQVGGIMAFNGIPYQLQ